MKLRDQFVRCHGNGLVANQANRLITAGFPAGVVGQIQVRSSSPLPSEISTGKGDLFAAHHKLDLSEKKMLSGDQSETDSWKRYDWEFHLALIQACRSRNLLNVHSIVSDKYLRYQMLVLTNRGDEAVREHKNVFERALVRDVNGARAALEEHIVNGLNHTLRRLAGNG